MRWGLAMFIWNDILCIIWEDLVIDTLELLCIKIRKPKSKPLLIATWYGLPNSSHDIFQQFKHFLKVVDQEQMEIIITGGLKCNFIEQTKSQITTIPLLQVTWYIL